MSLMEKISADIGAAMKARDAARLDALRAAKSTLMLKEVEAGKPLDDPSALNLIETLVKQRREAVFMYRTGGREDLAQKDEAQIAVLEGYLPSALSRDDLLAVIDSAIAETGAKEPKQQGLVMKTVMAMLKGRRADGKEVAQLVGERLKGGG